MQTDISFCTKTFRKEYVGFDKDEKKNGTLTYKNEKWFTWKTPVMTVIYDASSDGEKKVTLCVGLNPKTSKTGERFMKILRYLDTKASTEILQGLSKSTNYFAILKRTSSQHIRLNPVGYFSRQKESCLSLNIKKEATGEIIEEPTLKVFKHEVKRNAKIRCVVQCGRSWHYGDRTGISVILREVEVLKPDKPLNEKNIDFSALRMSREEEGSNSRFRSILYNNRPLVISMECPIKNYGVDKNTRGDFFLTLFDSGSLQIFMKLDRALGKLQPKYRNVVFNKKSVRFKLDKQIYIGNKKIKASELAKTSSVAHIQSLIVECRCAYFVKDSHWTVSWFVRKLKLLKD